MTSYRIEVGYNRCHSKDEASYKLRDVVKAICAKPESIAIEAQRIEAIHVPKEYAERYGEPWQDSTIKIIEGERMQVTQLASGGGEPRAYKEAMRRAFLRLVIEAMHREGMEVSVYVT